jgi:hypothetical protein
MSEQSADRPHANRAASDTRTVLGYPLADRLVLFLGIPAVAVLVGLLLPVVARWVLGLSSGLPLRPLFRLIGSVNRPVEIVINLVIWLLLGLAVARVASKDATKMTLTDDELCFGTGSRRITRADTAAVFLDGRKLVVLDGESRQLARDTPQASAATLADAFRAHGYPWQATDPYADLYRPWTPETPDLPPAANAVLAARETALLKKAAREVDYLREAAEKLGFVVRDRDTRQFWRPLVRS